MTLTRRVLNEYVPVDDDPEAAGDGSLQPGSYRTVDRWELTGPR
ncbi:hypothetical protein GCM10010452_69030 [Crossiella cryophila]